MLSKVICLKCLKKAPACGKGIKAMLGFIACKEDRVFTPYHQLKQHLVCVNQYINPFPKYSKPAADDLEYI